MGNPGLADAVQHSLVDIYRHHFAGDLGRERLFLSSLAFFVTFGVVRAITHLIRAGVGPFQNVTLASGTHIHHLVWGILLLLLAGYLGLFEARSLPWLRFLVAVLFGVGAALTLDEFALWFYFADVYWEREGRRSIDAVLLFGSLLSTGIFGGPFLHAAGRHLWHRARRKAAVS